MALKWLEGFESGGASDAALRIYLARKYVTQLTSAVLTTTGRFGGYACKLRNVGSNYFQINLTSTQTLVVGFAFNAAAFADDKSIIEFRDAGTVQVKLETAPDGNLRILRGTTALGTTSLLGLKKNSWYYIEVKVKIDNSTGTYEVRVGGTDVLSDTGVDTQMTGNATADQVRFCGEIISDWSVDDIYVLDTTGALNNDFLGNVRIGMIVPNGDTVDEDFTPQGAGNNFDEVNDGVTTDDDATYNESSTATDKDLFDYTALTNIPTIQGVQILTEARETDATDYSLKSIAKSGGTEDADAGQALSSDYTIISRVVEDDPDSGNLWLLAEINAATFGYEAV